MTKDSGYEGFSDDERAAMKEYAAEKKTEVKRRGTSAAAKAEADKQDCLEKIAAMPDDDRAIAETLHGIVEQHAPHLAAKTWYGMPAYARDGKAVVFFKSKSKFKTRYSEVGFNEPAQLDDGDMWATAFAVIAMTPAVEQTLTGLVTKAAG
jgi:uncharacterized protein YdhG (YjbR/CyaY superfamily)